MPLLSNFPLAAIEPRLRTLLPADLYAAAWIEPTPQTLQRVFDHLRALQRILHDYMPRYLSDNPPTPGEARHSWQESTLMFTDLVGFTPLMEANASRGREGAEALLNVLNNYFATMIEIISKSGGNLLEFTGDAMLVQFPPNERDSETTQAVRAALRMQRAMTNFANIETAQGTLSLGMRIGLHRGRFVTADIGTPRRMEHVLLGKAVQDAKRAEGQGMPGRVNLTQAVYERVCDQFRFECGKPGYMLAVDDLGDEELGEYEINRISRRASNPVLFDRSVEGLVDSIEDTLTSVEPLASYIPYPILELIVQSIARRQITPNFNQLTVLFVNVIGLPESVDNTLPEEEQTLINSFSRAFVMTNAAVESRGGVLKKVTYDIAGSDMLIYFGIPNAHVDDPIRAADAALAICDIIGKFPSLTVRGREINVSYQIGMAQGSAFSAEFGEPRGRREFNILGDTLNTAARLMSRAVGNRILITESVYNVIAPHFKCTSLGVMPLKGKAQPMPVYELEGRCK